MSYTVVAVIPRGRPNVIFIPEDHELRDSVNLRIRAFGENEYKIARDLNDVAGVAERHQGSWTKV